MNVAHVVRKKKADSLDFYPTQPWVTRALVEYLGIRRARVWEPACGGGHLSEVLKEYGCSVYSTDVKDYGYVGFNGTHDFLESAPEAPLPHWIITNPPYKRRLAEKLAVKCVQNSSIGFALLCRNNWLEGSRRHNYLWSKYPPSQVMVLSERPGFVEDGCDVERTGMIAYSWFIWENFKAGKPTELGWFGPGTRNRCSRPFDEGKYGVSVIRGDAP